MLRRKLKLYALGLMLSQSILGCSSISQSSQTSQKDKITMEKVSFMNGEIKVVGNLFLPPNFDKNKRYAGIVTVHPFGGVKEQTSGLHARRLAEQGFVTLAFDASYYGESGGQPRNKEVPSMRVEDISSAISFLSNFPQVDPNKIGVLGICAGGGYSMAATQTDLRIKAVATISMFDLGSARREGVGGAISYEERVKRLKEIAEQTTKEARGEPIK